MFNAGLNKKILNLGSYTTCSRNLATALCNTVLFSQFVILKGAARTALSKNSVGYLKILKFIILSKAMCFGSEMKGRSGAILPCYIQRGGEFHEIFPVKLLGPYSPGLLGVTLKL